ncbi:hypothetical protein PHLGIDRAFT_288475 [Phlebiopsis gigantea 11061_1 CR5-6]|uniref:Uncharacterized protein n=1 Tax=Phlebiopsis gigantea (strain 11061_1 CR5-6) TaxID=745531 RepID=A0A0C3SBB5_PHLG1|nr:hypothetical protein PHLGIDRAFT_288475 [Phlebiopsis gigantea 11061_1 CR5-6]
MSYIIAGRAIKNEYLALGTLGLTGLLTSLAMGGGKKEASTGKQTIQQIKEAVKFDSSSRYVPMFTQRVAAELTVTALVSEEEQLMNSIKNFIAEAEKEAKH